MTFKYYVFMTTNNNTMIELAKKAIDDGITRGRFVREHTSSSDSIDTLQRWSDAYSNAMTVLQRRSDTELK